MSVAHRPVFKRGARSLLLLKLTGEPSFGLEVQACTTASGRSTFAARRVERLSPADRAGITRGDELLSVQVLGVDRHAYTWSTIALDRIEQLDQIWVVQIWVVKRDGHRLSELQEHRRARIQEKLTRAKEILVEGPHSRGDFIQSQLEKVVVLIYDDEHKLFGALWRALPEDDRSAIAIPIARSFLSQTQLPGVPVEASNGRTTPIPSFPSTPAQSQHPQPQSINVATDSEATESIVSTPQPPGTPEEAPQSEETEEKETKERVSAQRPHRAAATSSFLWVTHTRQRDHRLISQSWRIEPRRSAAPAKLSRKKLCRAHETAVGPEKY